jgi:hypothetical protein
MSTIAINPTLETAMKTALDTYAHSKIKQLCERDGIDFEEALRFLDMSKDKVVRKEKSPKASPKSEPKSIKEKKDKKDKKDKDGEPKVKKPRKQSGHQLFLKAMRPEVADELGAIECLVELQEKLKLQETPAKFLKGPHVMIGLNLRWKELSDEEKTEWNDKAVADASTASESE